jgi:hypothetical protein
LLIDVPSTVSVLLEFSALPLPICRFAIDGLMSRVTVLEPSVMHTFALLLLGTPLGLQFPAVFQLLLPSAQVDGALNVQVPASAAAGLSNVRIATAAIVETAASARRRDHLTALRIVLPATSRRGQVPAADRPLSVTAC